MRQIDARSTRHCEPVGPVPTAGTTSDRLATLLALTLAIAVLAGARAWRSVEVDGRPRPRPPAQIRIDPNTAAWWELSMLPQVGDSLAREIVAFRTQEGAASGPAYRRAADLDRVPGIGPKTVQRIAPFLRFRSQEPDRKYRRTGR